VSYEFSEQVTISIAGRIDRPQIPVVKLIAIDAPGIANLALAAANRAPIQSMMLSMNGMSIQMDSVVVGAVKKMGKEFALPGQYVASSNDPELVSLTLTWDSVRVPSSSVTITDTASNSATFNIAAGTTAGCNAPVRIQYVVLDGVNSVPSGFVPAYRYDMSINNDFSVSSTASFGPVKVYSPSGTTTSTACLYGSIVSGQNLDQINIAHFDSAGRPNIHEGVTLSKVILLGYRLYSGDNGLPILAVDFTYDDILMEYGNDAKMRWNVPTNTGG
jgi:hypothetical protein